MNLCNGSFYCTNVQTFDKRKQKKKCIFPIFVETFSQKRDFFLLELPLLELMMLCFVLFLLTYWLFRHNVPNSYWYCEHCCSASD